MEKFTIKDFIKYNSPCIGCNSLVAIRFAVQEYGSTYSPIPYLNPIVNRDYTQIDLKITYYDRLWVKIFHKNNKFYTSNIDALIKYINAHRIFLDSACPFCYSNIQSRELHFNLEKRFVEPIQLATEQLIIYDKNDVYQLQSSFTEKETILVVEKNKTGNQNYNFLKFNLPLTPRYKFESRAQLIDKFKLYCLFS